MLVGRVGGRINGLARTGCVAAVLSSAVCVTFLETALAQTETRPSTSGWMVTPQPLPSARAPLSATTQPSWIIDGDGRWADGDLASAIFDLYGGYSTYCVRLCDGFYFPISHGVTSGQFPRDAEACRRRCAFADARLFYRPRHSRSITAAVDLSGRAYRSLANAFRYRRTMVNGCACQPEPWSEHARWRHRQYRLAQPRTLPASPSPAGGDEHAGTAQPMVAIAGAYPDDSAASANGSVQPAPTPQPRPQPLAGARPFRATATQPQPGPAMGR